MSLPARAESAPRALRRSPEDRPRMVRAPLLARRGVVRRRGAAARACPRSARAVQPRVHECYGDEVLPWRADHLDASGALHNVPWNVMPLLLRIGTDAAFDVVYGARELDATSYDWSTPDKSSPRTSRASRGAPSQTWGAGSRRVSQTPPQPSRSSPRAGAALRSVRSMMRFGGDRRPAEALRATRGGRDPRDARPGRGGRR